MLILRHMTAHDIAQSMVVERLSFPDPWPARSYYFEVNESGVSHMVVLEQTSPLSLFAPKTPSALGSLQRMLRQLSGANALAPANEIVGFAGLWCIADEAHISTIATHPNTRGKGYGEALLSGMIQRSIRLKATYLVLEVRVGNAPAQGLYTKYGFTISNNHKHYYSDGENAYEMRLEFTPDTIARLNALHESICAKIALTDHYSVIPHPRFGV